MNLFWTLLIFSVFFCSCIKAQKGKEPESVGNKDYQPYCPPLTVATAQVSEWTKKYKKSFQLDPNEEDECTFEEEDER